MRTERDLAPEPRENRRRFMIAGEHVILRAFEREDAERCYRWMNDPNIVRTLKARYPIAFSNEVEWLDRDRTHIGNASIHGIDWVSRTAWFGLFIGEPTAWNRGFGGDAIGGFVQEGTLIRDFYREGAWHDIVVFSVFREVRVD
ncbi:MAG TPA: hypothetical protein VGK04_00705 [Thermoanaerobaculia bacterium]|jgi:RimJ/RimL family protein N-acetyltransferase